MSGKAQDKQDDKPVIVVFRDDLRLGDNKALSAAAASGRRVLPLYVLDERRARRPMGAARRWWLHHSLTALSEALDKRGAPLLLRSGDTHDIVRYLADEIGAGAVYWNRCYDPAVAAKDTRLKTALREDGIEAVSFDGQLLHEPTRLKTGGGTPFKVFTPFWKHLSSQGEPRDPVDAPRKLTPYDGKLKGDKLDDWHLLPTKPDWAGGLRETWTPGEEGAKARLAAFLEDALDGYAEGRDIPGREATSRLSPHLAAGEITPYQILHALTAYKGKASSRDIETFRKEVGWREFSYHLLFHNPDLADKNFNDRFDAFEWGNDSRLLKAWQGGLTGYPIVDAGLRQLWQTGWMHNRVRMIVASLLVKHLLIDWRRGEDWFWDTLVDADPANNPASWQWVAGSGADASPYFRVFNPVLQGQKFDPDGAYVRRYVPELAELPDKYLHNPWDAPKSVLEEAGVKLGADYPVALVEHQRARDRALHRYQQLKEVS